MNQNILSQDLGIAEEEELLQSRRNNMNRHEQQSTVVSSINRRDSLFSTNEGEEEIDENVDNRVNRNNDRYGDGFEINLNDEGNEGIISNESERIHRQYRRLSTLDPLLEATINSRVEGLRDAEGDHENIAAENGESDAFYSGDGGSNEGDEAESFAQFGYIQLWLGQDLQHHYNLDDNDDDDENNDPPRPAREHAYLPSAQPLYPEEWILAGQHKNKQQERKNRDQNTLVDDNLPNEREVSSYVQDKNDVIDENSRSTTKFCIPTPFDSFLNSHNTTCIQDLFATEANCHFASVAFSPIQNPEILLPILEIDNVILFPGSSLPLRLRDSNWIEYLGNLIDDARGFYGAHSSNNDCMSSRTVPTGVGEVKIGILPRIPRKTRRHPRDTGARTGRWRIDLIRRGVASLRRPRRLSEDDSARGTNTATQALNEENTDMRQETDEVRSTQHNRSEPTASEEDDFFHPSSPSHITQHDPLIGRIGTMATITFTHEEAASSVIETSAESIQTVRGTTRREAHNRPSSIVWQRHRGELVITALGTKRFRIVRSSSDPSAQDLHHSTAATTGIPLYVAAEINDGNVTFPPTWLVQRSGNVRCSVDTSFSKSQKSCHEDVGVILPSISTHDSESAHSKSSIDKGSHSNVMFNLSLRSSIPALAFRTIWPWRISQEICNNILEMESFHGIQEILPTAAGVLAFHDTKDAIQPSMQFQVVDNSAFANWLACNMPLSQNDKLDILEMPSVVQQLRYILSKVKKARETLLRCKHCGTEVAKMRDVFTVGGAEGTTGAYVNEHGVVHQTVTLRKVNIQTIVAVGPSETKDSWFPGYSWTISYCGICHSHVGWMFRKVRKRVQAQEVEDFTRPSVFWGLSSITTEENVSPQRVYLV